MPALLQFTSAGLTSLEFQSRPSPLPLFDPMVNSFLGLSAGNVLYSQNLGNDSLIMEISFPKESPLQWNDYDRSYDYNSGVQAANTQSLVNWIMNVAQGSKNSFTVVYRGKSYTVNLINEPTLGFKPLNDTHLVGRLFLRKQL